MRSPKVVHVCQLYTPELGYQEVHLARAQRELGYDVTVLTSTFRQSSHLRGGSQERYSVGHFVTRDPSVTVHRLPSIRVGTRLWLRGLNRHLGAVDPDWIIVHGLTSLITVQVLSFLTRSRRRIPLTIDDHTTSSMRRRTAVGNLVYRLYRHLVAPRLLSHDVDLIGITPETGQVLTESLGLPSSHIRFVPLGADARRFSPDDKARESGRLRFGYKSDDIVVVYAGKLTPEKKVRELIIAVGTLLPEFDRLCLLIVGDGPAEYVDAIRSDIGAAPLASRVTLRPAVPHDDLATIFQLSDIGVWPGSESIVQIEAMACGLPVIIRDLASLANRVAGGAGFTTTGAVDDIANKLRPLVAVPAFRREIGTLARQRVVEQMSWTNVARQFDHPRLLAQ